MMNPAILHALNPAFALEFLLGNQAISFAALGMVVLAVTGAEALYADMGHLGKRPIRLAWLILAMPALVLNYFGQGALVLADTATARNPFYLLAPQWAQIPLIVLSTLATVIAAQSIITGIYTLTQQAIRQGFCPRYALCLPPPRNRARSTFRWLTGCFLPQSLRLFWLSGTLLPCRLPTALWSRGRWY